MKPKFIDANQFLEYTGIDLSAALKDNDNPSAKVESFLGRVELRVMSWVDKNTFRVKDWESLTNYQLRMFRYALLEQAAYMFRNGDIAQDSGYDQERGVVAEKRMLQEITVCQPCIDFLIQAGLFNATIKNRRRFMHENVLIGDGLPSSRGPGESYIPGGQGNIPVPGYYTKEQMDQIIEDLRTYINAQNDLDEKKANKTTVFNDNTTNDQYPGAKAIFDYTNTFGYSVEMSVDEQYHLILNLKDKNGTVISTQTTTLPSRTGFTDVSYDDEEKELIFTLGSGDEVSVYIGSITDDYYTKAESDARYTKKEDVLPHLYVEMTDNVLDFITDNNLLGKEFIMGFPTGGAGYSYICQFWGFYPFWGFEIESLTGTERYYSNTVDLSNLTFSDIITTTIYRQDYALETGTLTELETLAILRGN